MCCQCRCEKYNYLASSDEIFRFLSEDEVLFEKVVVTFFKQDEDDSAVLYSSKSCFELELDLLKLRGIMQDRWRNFTWIGMHITEQVILYPQRMKLQDGSPF